ncbi:MAG: Tfp pilus assembly protein FimT/FimU [Succinivibrionaceae bacterium]
MGSKGFSLVELVIVMLLVGILAVTASVKIGTMMGYEQGAGADEFYGRLRLVQEMNMSRDDGSCVAAIMGSRGIWHQDLDSCSVADFSQNRLDEIVFDNTAAVDGKTNMTVTVIFDRKGDPVFCGKTAGTSISVNLGTPAQCGFTIGSDNIPFTINEEGYITYGG